MARGDVGDQHDVRGHVKGQVNIVDWVVDPVDQVVFEAGGNWDGVRVGAPVGRQGKALSRS